MSIWWRRVRASRYKIGKVPGSCPGLATKRVRNFITLLFSSKCITFIFFIQSQSIISGDCPCIFQPLSSETVVFSISPLLLRYTPQCYGARQGRWGIVQACCIADILIDRKEIKKRGYIVSMYPLFSERKTRLKLATLSLEG